MNASRANSRSAGLILERKIQTGVALFAVGALVWLLAPSGFAPDSRPIPVCHKNLKRLAIALYNYHDHYGSFPPAYIADQNGRPLRSWRVLLLPFLGHSNLYARYRFDEPWNGPHNRALASEIPAEYRCPSDTGPAGDTSYLAVIGPKTVFPGARPISIKDISDGRTVTILLVEAADSGIKWLEPRDMTYAEACRGINAKPGLSISSRHGTGARVLFADGHAEFLSDKTPVERLRLLLERNDGQPVPYIQE